MDSPCCFHSLFDRMPAESSLHATDNTALTTCLPHTLRSTDPGEVSPGSLHPRAILPLALWSCCGFLSVYLACLGCLPFSPISGSGCPLPARAEHPAHIAGTFHASLSSSWDVPFWKASSSSSNLDCLLVTCGLVASCACICHITEHGVQSGCAEWPCRKVPTRVDCSVLCLQLAGTQ